MLPKNLETLKKMNSSTGKFATWYVRVIAPKIIDYTFQARGETIAAQKFECVLVSKDSTQYMLGLVPFAFSDRGAAQKAMDKSQRTMFLKSRSRRLTPKLSQSSTVAP